MVVTGRDRSDAVDWLAHRAGLHPDRPLPPVRPRRPATTAAVEPSPLVTQYVDACHHILTTRTGRSVRDWLKARGIDDTTIDANRLGADPGRTGMRRARGLPYGAGVAAVLPVLDPTGRVVYVQARYLHADRTGRKYDNPAAAIAPHPRLAFPAPTGQDRGGVMLVCEGLPDGLVASQAGYRSVALLGAHTPDDAVAARIANHADRHDLTVGIVCDPDPAGRHATATLATLLDRVGVEPRVVVPPDGCDVNAWALTDPQWAAQLDESLAVGVAGVDR
jgi:hypothetical protein